jgi:hypothetical protein
VRSSGYVPRASRRRLPAARSAGNRVEAADGASFVVFIFLGLMLVTKKQISVHFEIISVKTAFSGFRLRECLSGRPRAFVLFRFSFNSFLPLFPFFPPFIRIADLAVLTDLCHVCSI